MQKELVSPDWLKENLSHPQLVILDSSPASTVSGNESPYQEVCIPHSRIFDLKGNFADKESPFPNTVPTASHFEQGCRALGINTDSEIVVYDNLGIYTSPRVWWLFKVMGHSTVKVLDGGLPAWIEMGYEAVPKSESTQAYPTGNFTSDFHPEYVITYEDILENVESNKFLIVDARAAGRFQGTAPEPRKHLQSGSIPHSVNIPWKQVLDHGKFKSEEELHQIFREQGVDEDTKLVFSCGSGLTACIVSLASEMAFNKSKFVYDGSWTEYAELQHLRTDG